MLAKEGRLTWIRIPGRETVPGGELRGREAEEHHQQCLVRGHRDVIPDNSYHHMS